MLFEKIKMSEVPIYININNVWYTFPELPNVSLKTLASLVPMTEEEKNTSVKKFQNDEWVDEASINLKIPSNQSSVLNMAIN